MKEDINLVEQKKTDTTIKSVFNPLIALFGIVFLVSIGLIVYAFILSSTSETLADTANNIKAELGKSAKKQKYQIVTERLNSIKNVLETRSKVSQITSKIISNVPDEFSVDLINGSDREVLLSVSSTELSSFATYLESTLPKFAKNNSKVISKIEISDFAETKEGYTLSLVFKVINL